ncbi:MAG: M48 family metalloprotease [Sulfuricella sp.]|nr:M48 family metalloprotease [Sulfuricella sp.]
MRPAQAWLPVAACIALGACATTTSPQGRSQLTAPPALSAVYSEMDMQAHLMTSADAGTLCAGMECLLNHAFDQQVQRLGARLAESAFATYPDLKQRIGKFEFVVAEKAEPGTASNSSGTVVIFRGVQKLHLSEEAIAFLIAREMGHAISRHHDENSAVSILFSVVAQVLLPVANLVRGSVALIQTASAATTAASFIGSRAMIENNKPEQMREADAIALELLAKQGWNKRDIADALASGNQAAGDDTWSKGLRLSAARID